MSIERNYDLYILTYEVNTELSFDVVFNQEEFNLTFQKGFTMNEIKHALNISKSSFLILWETEKLDGLKFVVEHSFYVADLSPSDYVYFLAKVENKKNLIAYSLSDESSSWIDSNLK